ncbi:chloride channel protein [Flavicella sediminum]|uniref:chloride channel protein n=1 Tax=Flavicella sediminum TaxID=2585141 RepID=UPI0011200AA2|nr:chloride channel protein [Flavicella sediminum]
MPQKKNLITKFLIWKYKHISNQQFIYLVSILIGLLSGLAAVTLKNLTHLIQEGLRHGFIKKYHEAFYFIFPIIGLFLTLIIIKYIVKRKVSHGIPSTLHAISKRKGIMARYKMYSSVLTAPVTVGFGGSVGLEGPTVATSAAIGSNISRLFHLNQTSRTLLIGAAAAAAMSSIFKAPIAAIVFAVEIFSLDLTLVSLVPLLLASISAILTSYFFLGDDSLLHFQLKDKFELIDTGFYAVLGVSCGLISVYFSKVYFAISDFFSKFANPYKRLLIGGLGLGVIVYFIPPLFGEGFKTINNLLNENVSQVFNQNIFHVITDNNWIIIMFLIGLVLFKVIATSITFGAGGVGGVFAPSLFTGSITGYVFALFCNTLGLSASPLSQSNFALVGMAGLMAGVLHAPLTAIFLIAEITSGHELFIPLMITAAISYLIAKKYIPFNIYAAELAKKGELMTHDKDKNVLMLMDIDKVIETNFISLTPEMKLGYIAKEAVAKSSRNNFPVVNENNEYLGVLLLDDIRGIMFDQTLYDTISVGDLMHNSPEVIDYEKDTMKKIMKKFQDSSAWNLPVVKNGKYAGFISKSRLLSAYRRKLIEVTN